MWTGKNMKKLNREQFEQILKSPEPGPKNVVRVGMSTCGIAAGADKVYAVLQKEIKRRNLDVIVKKTGCLGMCYCEPLVEVDIEGVPGVIYGNVDEKAALGIVDKHLCGKRLMNDHVVMK